MEFKFPKLFIVCLAMWITQAVAQDPVRQSAAERYQSRLRVIENLAAQVETLTVEKNALTDSLTSIRRQNADLEEVNARLTKDVKQLEKNLEGALNEKLQSSHTNSVLFIFIFLVGIILILALIWFFMRKPKPVVQYQDTRRDLDEDDEDDDEDERKSNGNGLDHQLQRIEKLGSLREKGLLTEDEFNLQKKQILGERH